MELLDFSSKKAVCEYEKFVSEFGSFTQSSLWTKVKKGWLREAVLVRNKRGVLCGSMLLLIKKIPFLGWSFMYAPRGPVCDFHNREILEKLLSGAKELALKYHGVVLKCDPLFQEDDFSAQQNMEKLGFFPRPDLEEKTIQCKSNYELALCGKTEDDLFSAFHPKCRYNIRLAKKKGVVCRFYTADTVEKHIKDFYPLMKETGLRDGFCIRSEAYFSSMLKELGAEHCRLYLCWYHGIPISGAIAVLYGDRTSYVYGASCANYRSVMPNYLMQWEMIRWAVESKNKIYDFQGIPHYYDESHPNYGVYRFKRGFGGRIVTYSGEYDYLFSSGKYKYLQFFYKILKSGRVL